ncbi:MAG: type III pantothenate kinase [Leptospiraceae bacterium]|nr:type III pantothenate kinase [Leptospiraceae bacterium]MCP5500178.1 type III pantothenate kinase [Leptospiraceae bacterium]
MTDKLLIVDVGNTNTVIGVHRPGDKEPMFHRRTVTRRDRTSDELGLFLKGFLDSGGIKEGEIGHAIYSSVVPGFNPILERMLEDWFSVHPMKVHYEMKLPFKILYQRPFEIGADRLVNAAAAVEYFPGNSIIIDMGTATTFCVVNDKNEYLGGVIAPGLKISMETLHRKTAQLPPIVFQTPKQVLGDSTLESLQAGFYYGWVGLLKNIIMEIKKEYGSNYRVIGTGGLVTTIHSSTDGDVFDIIDPLLTLNGLEVLHRLNV